MLVDYDTGCNVNFMHQGVPTHLWSHECVQSHDNDTTPVGAGPSGGAGDSGGSVAAVVRIKAELFQTFMAYSTPEHIGPAHPFDTSGGIMIEGSRAQQASLHRLSRSSPNWIVPATDLAAHLHLSQCGGTEQEA